MKKLIKLLSVISICFIVTGCSNEFAKREYDSSEKISQTEDLYSKVGSIFNPIDGGYSLTVSKFDGRQTLWTDTAEEDKDIEINISFQISEGKAKIVHVDSEENVTTVIECSPETSTDEYVTEKVSLKRGKNRLKIVGYDCRDIDVKILFEDL